jgi:AmmeMemoRadiSam system protein B
MGTIRRPAVAGTFYPGSPAALDQALDRLLKDVPPRQGEPPGQAPKALVVPHAGYVYSGPVAARAYAALAGFEGLIRHVVLLGPAHYAYVDGLAAPSAESFDTPLGPLAVDRAAVEAAASLPQVVLSDGPHGPEHSLEVQLPFIRRVMGEVAIVPLLVGDAGAREVAEVLDLLWDGPETLVIVSTDLSHYQGYEAARRRDAGTAAAIEALDGSGLVAEEACGYRALAGLLMTARRRALRAERLDLRNSGDTVGPRDRVVGYGAWVFR